MSDKARELVAGLQRAWNEKDWEKLEALHTDNWIEHNLPDGMNDLAGLKSTFYIFTTAFPDLEFKPIKIISDGEYVSSQYEITGTHTGDFMGIPATGRSIRFRGITQLVMRENKCVQAWTVLDQLTLLQQIGAVPAVQ